MILTRFQWYILAINLAAFLIYTIDFQIYVHGGDGIKPEVLCNLATIFGGAPGTLAAELIWDRKVNKTNAQSRMYTVFWLILQLALFWILWGPNRTSIQENLHSFYSSHIILCWWYAIINAVTFVAFAVDKIKAVAGAWRIREVTLLGLCLLGGGAGGLLAMDICNHKINSMHFVISVPLLMCLHLVLIVLFVIGAF